MFLKELRSDWVKILSFLNQASFLSGNLVLYFIFQSFIDSAFIMFLISTCVSFLIIGRLYDYKMFLWWLVLISLIFFFPGIYSWVLPVLWVIISFLIFLNFAKEKYKEKKHPTYKLKFLSKIIFVLPKTYFFSTAHIIFSLLLIWLLVIGAGYLTGRILLTNFETLVALIGILGLLSGFYQFYIERYNEKIQKKIVAYFISKVIPKEKISIKSYKKFINKSEDKYDSVVSNLKRLENGKLYFLGRFRQIQKAQELTFLNIAPGQDELAYFTYLEQECEDKKNKKLRKQLLESYEKFFEEKKEEVLNSLDKEDLSEIKWLLLRNINILEEALADLISFNFEEPDKPSSYDDFMRKFTVEIYEEVFYKYIFV